MLTLVSDSWYRRVSAAFGGTDTAAFFFDQVEGAHPWTLGYKPRTTDCSVVGDKELNHVQLHGYLCQSVNFKPHPRSYNGYKPLAIQNASMKGTVYYYHGPQAKNPTFSYTIPIFKGQCLTSADQKSTYDGGHGSRREYVWGDINMGYVELECSVMSDGDIQLSVRAYCAQETQREGRGTVLLQTYPQRKIRLALQRDKTPLPYGTNKYYRLYDVEFDLTKQVDYFKVDVGYSNHKSNRDMEFVTAQILNDVEDQILRAFRRGTFWPTAKVTQHLTYYLLPIQGQKISCKQALRMRDELRDIALSKRPRLDKQVILGDATQSAADAIMEFTGNTATLAKELFELKDTLTDLVKLLGGKADIKSVSNLWLSARYGIKLTYQDTLSLAEAIIAKCVATRKDRLYSWSRGGVVDGTSVARCKLYFDPERRNAFASAVAGLMQWDLFPSLANVWDIIPYSFVADWFVDIEGFLSAIDTNTYLSVAEVFATCYSLKRQWEMDAMVTLGCSGHWWASQYERLCPPEPYQPIPHFSGGSLSIKNIVDGAALIIQRN